MIRFKIEHGQTNGTGQRELQVWKAYGFSALSRQQNRCSVLCFEPYDYYPHVTLTTALFNFNYSSCVQLQIMPGFTTPFRSLSSTNANVTWWREHAHSIRITVCMMDCRPTVQVYIDVSEKLSARQFDGHDDGYSDGQRKHQRTVRWTTRRIVRPLKHVCVQNIVVINRPLSTFVYMLFCVAISYSILNVGNSSVAARWQHTRRTTSPFDSPSPSKPRTPDGMSTTYY